MTHNWFECKIKYLKIDEISGVEKKATEPYLVDAVSFTEAEARVSKEMEQMIGGDFTVHAISRSNITEIYPNENGDKWFKATVTFIDIDENSGKEKKTKNYMLVEANDVRNAYDLLMEALSNMIVPYEAPSVAESPILDVFPYFNNPDIPQKKNKIIECKNPTLEVYENYDISKCYSVGNKVLVNGEKCVIISNGVNAKFRIENYD